MMYDAANPLHFTLERYSGNNHITLGRLYSCDGLFSCATAERVSDEHHNFLMKGVSCLQQGEYTVLANWCVDKYKFEIYHANGVTKKFVEIVGADDPHKVNAGSICIGRKDESNRGVTDSATVYDYLSKYIERLRNKGDFSYSPKPAHIRLFICDSPLYKELPRYKSQSDEQDENVDFNFFDETATMAEEGVAPV